MECICWNCGKKIPSSKLLFKFTNFYRKIIPTAIEETSEKDLKEGTSVMGLKEGADILLNAKDFFESEESLCGLRPDGADKTKKTFIQYPFPYAQLLFKGQKIAAFEEGVQEKVEDFREWLKRRIIRNGKETETYRLSVVNSGGGDIEIDQVVYEPEDGGAAFVDTQDGLRYCPSCKQPVSFLSGRYKEVTVSVIGGPRVSKSTAMTACASFFMGQNGTTQIRWEPCKWDETYGEYEKKCLDPYKEGKALQPTDTTIENIPKVAFKVIIPGYKEPLSLMFVDLPGEFNNSDGISETLVSKYSLLYENINYIWYCTDRGEIEAFQVKGEDLPIHIRELGYENGKLPLRTDVITHNMYKLRSRFENAKIIYLVGKTDAMESGDQSDYELYNADEPMEQRVVQDFSFDVRRFFEKNKKVEQYIDNYNQELSNSIRECFKNRCMMATSAYGYPPTNDAQESRPYQCALPFFWMMAVEGKMPMKTKIGNTQIEKRLSDMSEKERIITESNLYGKTQAFLTK